MAASVEVRRWVHPTLLGCSSEGGCTTGLCTQHFSASCLNPWLLCRSTQKTVETAYDAAASPSFAQKGLN